MGLRDNRDKIGVCAYFMVLKLRGVWCGMGVRSMYR